MSNSNEPSSFRINEKLNRYGVRYILREFASTFIYIAIALLAAGTFGWIHVWILAGLMLSYQLGLIIILYKFNPQVLNTRGKLIQEYTKLFDKIFVVVFILLAYAMPAVAGLDAVRFQWSSMGVILNLVGGLIFVGACLFGAWAITVNSHFEMTVFVKDQEQKVCTSGPYRFIRHPGYAAEILALFSVPLILGSWFSFIPAGALSVVFVIRTALEDKTLHNELPGYQEYAQTTRYRLIPFIW